MWKKVSEQKINAASCSWMLHTISRERNKRTREQPMRTCSNCRGTMVKYRDQCKPEQWEPPVQTRDSHVTSFFDTPSSIYVFQFQKKNYVCFIHGNEEGDDFEYKSHWEGWERSWYQFEKSMWRKLMQAEQPHGWSESENNCSE